MAKTNSRTANGNRTGFHLEVACNYDLLQRGSTPEEEVILLKYNCVGIKLLVVDANMPRTLRLFQTKEDKANFSHDNLSSRNGFFFSLF